MTGTRDGYIEQALRSFKSRRGAEIKRRTNGPSEGRARVRVEKPGPPRLTQSQIDVLRYVAHQRFFAAPALSHGFRLKWDSRVQNTPVLDKDLERALTRDLSREYAHAVASAVTHYVDLLAQAALARTKKMSAHLFDLLLKDGLQFADSEADWDVFTASVDKTGFMVTAVSFNSLKDRIRDVDHIVKARRAVFETQIQELYWREWLGAADQSIRLRMILTGSAAAAGSGLKFIIRMAAERNPAFTQREICGRVDDLYATRQQEPPMPSTWKKAGSATLVEAYDNPKTQKSVKTYFSKVTRVTTRSPQR